MQLAYLAAYNQCEVLMAERFDQRRFEELILFVARRCEGDSTFGATKLNKLLFSNRQEVGAERAFGELLDRA
jgi:hypothetical protein